MMMAYVCTHTHTTYVLYCICLPRAKLIASCTHTHIHKHTSHIYISSHDATESECLVDGTHTHTHTHTQYASACIHIQYESLMAYASIMNMNALAGTTWRSDLATDATAAVVASWLNQLVWDVPCLTGRRRRIIPVSIAELNIVHDTADQCRIFLAPPSTPYFPLWVINAPLVVQMVQIIFNEFTTNVSACRKHAVCVDILWQINKYLSAKRVLCNGYKGNAGNHRRLELLACKDFWTWRIFANASTTSRAHSIKCIW